MQDHEEVLNSLRRQLAAMQTERSLLQASLIGTILATCVGLPTSSRDLSELVIDGMEYVLDMGILLGADPDISPVLVEQITTLNGQPDTTRREAARHLKEHVMAVKRGEVPECEREEEQTNG